MKGLAFAHIDPEQVDVLIGRGHVRSACLLPMGRYAELNAGL